MPLLLAQRLADLFQFIGTVVRLLPDIAAHVNGSLGLGRQHHAIAGAGVDFDHLRVHFVVRPQDDPRKISVAPEGVDLPLEIRLLRLVLRPILRVSR